MSSLPDDADELVDENVAAPFLGLKPKTLANQRHRGGGPEYYKIGSSVRYSLRVLAQYREARRRSSTSQHRAEPKTAVCE
jgi:hypothetical protein